MFQRSGPNADPCGHPLFITCQELVCDLILLYTKPVDSVFACSDWLLKLGVAPAIYRLGFYFWFLTSFQIGRCPVSLECSETAEVSSFLKPPILNCSYPHSYCNYVTAKFRKYRRTLISEGNELHGMLKHI